nr:MAG TPA: hypothetical protein [Caudoviricetes sp.]
MQAIRPAPLISILYAMNSKNATYFSFTTSPPEI